MGAWWWLAIASGFLLIAAQWAEDALQRRRRARPVTMVDLTGRK